MYDLLGGPAMSYPSFRRRHVPSKPITSLDSLESAAYAFRNQVRSYSIRKDGFTKISDEALEELADRSSSRLPALNPRARVAFAEALFPALMQLISRRAEDQVMFLTFAPLATTLNVQEVLDGGPEFVRHLIGRTISLLREGCSELSYFGLVDVALYTSVPTAKNSSLLSFHVHALVWGEKSIRESILSSPFNDFRALVRGLPALRLDVVLEDVQINQKIFYMSKPPIRQYRAYEIKENSQATGKWRQKKAPLRSIDSVKMCEIFRSISLGELCVAGGDAESLIGIVCDDARSRCNARNLDDLKGVIRSLGPGWSKIF